MKKQFKRIFSIFLVSVILSVLTFGFINRPIKTHALPIAAIALGSGALGAIVAAYFATAGVQFSGSGDADGNFLGNYVANWVKNSTGYENNSYFDNSGNFIGSSSDLSVVQNEESGLVSFIFGKDFAMWLEALKSSYVYQLGLQENVTTTIFDESGLTDMSGHYFRIYYPVSEGANQIVNVADINEGGFDFYNKGVSFTAFSEDSAIRVTSPYGGSLSNAYLQFGTYNNSTFVSSSGNNFSATAGRSLVFAHFNNVLNVCIWGRISGNKYFLTSLGTILDEQNLDYKSIELTGELTEGYEDFEEAINQDLTNADEEEVAVVDVGTFPEVLDPTALIDGILDKIVDGTLNPEYDGTRENTEEAEEEKEGSKPFTPTVPEGWVIVNGLEDFFPFCIPWDLYNLIAELNVPAEAPKFTYKVDLDAAIDGLEYDAELDLAPFETVARIFRIICVIGFVFFLILKTRDLIRG